MASTIQHRRKTALTSLDFLIASLGIQEAATDFPTRDGGEKKEPKQQMDSIE